MGVKIDLWLYERKVEWWCGKHLNFMYETGKYTKFWPENFK
jgi:hypothetical protein